MEMTFDMETHGNERDGGMERRRNKRKDVRTEARKGGRTDGRLDMETRNLKWKHGCK